LLAAAVTAQEPRTRVAEPAAVSIPAPSTPTESQGLPIDRLPAADAAEPPRPSEDKLAVPEPSMLLLVGGGLVWLALAKRRFRLRGPQVAVRGPQPL
jgi:hypothetical protein